MDADLKKAAAASPKIRCSDSNCRRRVLRIYVATQTCGKCESVFCSRHRAAFVSNGGAAGHKCAGLNEAYHQWATKCRVECPQIVAPKVTPV